MIIFSRDDGRDALLPLARRYSSLYTEYRYELAHQNREKVLEDIKDRITELYLTISQG